jgi:hypothetical protein
MGKITLEMHCGFMVVVREDTHHEQQCKVQTTARHYHSNLNTQQTHESLNP